MKSAAKQVRTDKKDRTDEKSEKNREDKRERLRGFELTE